MTTQDEIIAMLETAKRLPVPVSRQSNLHTDLGLDSLSFVSFLVKVEDAYSIIFDLPEMARCMQTGQLIALVEAKEKERDSHA